MANIKKRKLGAFLMTAVLVGVFMMTGCSLLKDKENLSKSTKVNVNENSKNTKEEAAMDKKDNSIVEAPVQIIKNALKPKDVKETDNVVSEEKSVGFSELEQQIKDLCKDNGQWSIYVKDLKSGKELSINNKEMVAASVIKLFIMAKVYEAIDAGELERDKTVDGLLKKMITISDNAASNRLVELLGEGSHEKGMVLVNSYAKSIKCLDTKKNRKFYDSNPPANTKQNFTSVEDCGKLLERIYNKECVSEEYDKEMMDLMLAQERNSKLPALLPKGVKLAHKTGEISNAEHDVGIVFAPETDYIICVMSNELNNSAQGRETVAKISKVVYGYFDSEDYKN